VAALNDWREARCQELWAQTAHGSQPGAIARVWPIFNSPVCEVAGVRSVLVRRTRQAPALDRAETIRGHVFCSFLALVLKKALEDRIAPARNEPAPGLSAALSP
jgi:hypothetical protein